MLDRYISTPANIAGLGETGAGLGSRLGTDFGCWPGPHRPVIPFGWRGEVWGRVGGGKCLGLVAKAPPSCGPAARAAHRKILVFSMNQLEQLAHDVRGFATEVRTLGYSSVAGGHENRFLELSERMMWQADQADGNKSLRRLTVPRNYP